MEGRIKKILSDILDIEPEEINDEFGPDDADEWDSMNNLRIITALEKEFNIKLSMQDIRRMINAGKVKEVIASYLEK